MRVLYLTRTEGACDLYRVVQPLTIAAKQFPQHQFKSLGHAEIIAAANNDDATLLMPLVEADVIVAPRMWGSKSFFELKNISPRAKMVLEYDDDLFNVSPLSPHYVDHGVEEVRYLLPGETKPREVWVDGKNGFNLEKNRQMMQGTIEAVKNADMVTVTTPILAKAYEQWNKNIVPLPNCVNLGLWQRLPLQPHKGIRIGWFGGHSHYGDWTLLDGVIQDVMARFPEVTLVIMGALFGGTLKGIDPSRIEHHSWVPVSAYPYKSAILDLDIGIIPLQDNVFNNGKSSIKFLEMSALEVPCVVSYVSPYKECATEQNGVWIEGNDKEGWIKGLNLLIRNESLRKIVGKAARKDVEKNFSATKTAELWVKAYESLVKKPEGAPR